MNIIGKFKRSLVWTAVFSLIIQASFLSVLLTPQKAQAAVATHLVISEIQVKDSGAGGADKEFVELYNPTSSNINLSTLPLKLHIINSSGTDENRALTFINSTIYSNGFFLIAPVGSYATSIGADATYSTSGNMIVKKGAVYISTSISNDTGVIDLFGFKNSTKFEGEEYYKEEPGNGKSAERKANVSSSKDSMNGGGSDEFGGNAWDTDNNKNDFVDEKDSNPQNSSSPIEDIIAPVATLSGTPSNPTNSTGVDITVGGSQIVSYKYNLDSLGYSSETLIATNITASGLTEGTHTLSVIGKDENGNWQEEVNATEFSWEIDLTPPTISVNEQLTNDKTPTITGEVENGATISVNVNGADYAGVNNEDGTWTADVTDELADSVYDVVATATDLAGNDGSDETSNELTIDTEKPVTSYSITGGKIKNGWYVGKKAPNIELTTETDATIFWQWEDEGFNSGLSPQAPIVTEGVRTLEFYSVDPATNEETPHQTREVKYDKTAPDAELSDLPADPTNQTSIEITVGGEGVVKYKYSLDGAKYSKKKNISEKISKTGLTEGIHNLKVIGIDEAGNEQKKSNATEFSWTIDLTAPTTLFSTDPATPNGENDWFKGSTIPKIILESEADETIFWKWSTESEFTNSGTNLLNINIPEGVNTIEFYSVDNATNVESPVQSEEVKYDGTAPNAPTSDPGEGEYLGDTTVTLSNEDAIELSLTEDVFTDSIYYTLDGTVPSLTNGTLYEGSFVLTETTLVKAIAIDQAGNESELYEALYEILAPEITNETATVVTETSVTITWTTVGHPSTSRVIYDITSRPDSSVGPNYGYAFSTVEDSTKVESHSVVVTDLVPGTTYYFRTVSHGSPESVSKEFSKQTNRTLVPVVSATLGATDSGTIEETALETTTVTETPTEEIKGDDTGSAENKEVKGESTEAEKSFWQKFGWLLALGAIGFFIIFFAWRNRREEN